MGVAGRDSSDCGCGNPNPITDASEGESFCGNCGVVLSQGEQVDELGTRMYDEGDDKRHHAPLSGPRKYAPGTEIGTKDAHGRGVDKEMKVGVMKMMNFRTKSDSKERNLRNAIPLLDDLFDKIGVNEESVRDQAAILYKKAIKANLTKGRPIPFVVSSCAYAAMKEHGIHRSMKEVCDATGIRKKDLFRVYSDLLKSSGDIGNGLDNIYSATGDISQYSSRISRILSQLNSDPRMDDIAKSKIGKECMDYAKELEGHREGKSYDTIAAALVYKVIKSSDYYVTQQMVAMAAGVTEVSVRSRYKKMESFLRKSQKTKSKPE